MNWAGDAPAAGWITALWRRLELAPATLERDIQVWCWQPLVGVAWVILYAATMRFIFAVIFGHMAKISIDGVPYPALRFRGLAPWTLFKIPPTRISFTNVCGRMVVA